MWTHLRWAKYSDAKLKSYSSIIIMRIYCTTKRELLKNQPTKNPRYVIIFITRMFLKISTFLLLQSICKTQSVFVDIDYCILFHMASKTHGTFRLSTGPKMTAFFPTYIGLVHALLLLTEEGTPDHFRLQWEGAFKEGLSSVTQGAAPSYVSSPPSLPHGTSTLPRNICLTLKPPKPIRSLFFCASADYPDVIAISFFARQCVAEVATDRWLLGHLEVHIPPVMDPPPIAKYLYTPDDSQLALVASVTWHFGG
ncbi:hypothetical protein GYMLUDRAFT_724813 [Collybiopsis luxurians FD-317 M1]|nr:hypothetical protein GYMLUDRAFT_724813 [Collybiopsis luxurians FD-317 M1]